MNIFDKAPAVDKDAFVAKVPPSLAMFKWDKDHPFGMAML